MNHLSSQSPPKQAPNGFYPHHNNNDNFINGNSGINNYNNNGNGYKIDNNDNAKNGGMEASKSNNNGNAVPNFNNAPISGQQLHTQNYVPSSVQTKTESYVTSF